MKSDILWIIILFSWFFRDCVWPNVTSSEAQSDAVYIATFREWGDLGQNPIEMYDMLYLCMYSMNMSI